MSLFKKPGQVAYVLNIHSADFQNESFAWISNNIFTASRYRKYEISMNWDEGKLIGNQVAAYDILLDILNPETSQIYNHSSLWKWKVEFWNTRIATRCQQTALALMMLSQCPKFRVTWLAVLFFSSFVFRRPKSLESFKLWKDEIFGSFGWCRLDFWLVFSSFG